MCLNARVPHREPCIYSLTYVSSASSGFTPENLDRLSAVSMHNNHRDHLTGALLFKEGTFMQVLEGEEATVNATFARIGRDSRHKGIITLLRCHISERQFPDWSMRLAVISGVTPASDTPGEVVKALLTPAPHNPATTLLRTFAGLRRPTEAGAQRRS
jgi:hypothetical protein